MIQLLIEGTNTEAAVTELKKQIPTAEELPQDKRERGLLSIATVIAIFGAIGAGAKMVKDVADMTKSVAELAKLLIDWKKESAKEEKTILMKEEPGKEKERLVLQADTDPEKLAAFLQA